MTNEEIVDYNKFFSKHSEGYKIHINDTTQNATKPKPPEERILELEKRIKDLESRLEDLEEKFW